jgi:hypothetical protein
MNDKTKQIIIAIVVIVIAFVVFKMYFSGSNIADQALTSDLPPAVTVVDGPAILSQLENLRSVTLDESVFTSAVFTGLINFERPIDPQPIGRQNPFLPIGREF